MSAFGVKSAVLAVAVLVVSGSALALPGGNCPRGVVCPVRPLPPNPPSGDSSAPPDASLYTTYSFWSSHQNVSWVVCGSTQQSEGCYGAGQLGPFGHVGALMEGDQTVTGNTVTRDIYVVDDAAGSGTGVTLDVYLKTDVVTSEYDTSSVTLKRTVNLPLTGGAGVTTFMAANKGYLFIGTNKSTSAVALDKGALIPASIGGFSPPGYVAAITSNSYGYVAVTFGGNSGSTGSYVYGPNGGLSQDGGSANLVLNNRQGVSTATLPTTTGNPAAIISPAQVRPVRLKRSGRLLGSGM